MMIEASLPAGETWIRQLLILSDLPDADIPPVQLCHFLTLKEKGQGIGIVGVEAFGRFGLLRSLAVDPRYRRRGFASQLVEKAGEYAASPKIESLYLLTIRAEGFFPKRDYQRVQRNSAPISVSTAKE